SALTYKAKAEAIIVVENLTVEAPKTKSFIAIEQNLNVAGKKILVVVPEVDTNLILSARNLQNVKVVLASNVNTYDVMNANQIVLAEGAVNVLNEMLA
ncbi:MAG: 50S ribosomal protein L4, partial [Rikenellaceae bacterium]|nr:50S ribosomal protein L4 [Rikenellaceae bacterium]